MGRGGKCWRGYTSAGGGLQVVDMRVQSRRSIYIYIRTHTHTYTHINTRIHARAHYTRIHTRTRTHTRG